MSNFPSKGTGVRAYTRFTLDSSTPSLWRVTFDHPPINLIDSVMIGELGELFADVERNEGPCCCSTAPTRTTSWRTTTSPPPTGPSSTHYPRGQPASTLGWTSWFDWASYQRSRS